MRVDRSRRVALFCLLVTSAFALVALKWLGPGVMPVCQIQRLTGYHCPGCGMTRAVQAVLDGRWGEAFWLNPLMIVLFPMFGIWLLWFLLRPIEVSYRAEKWVGFCVILLLVVYGVLRNIPEWPFELLAPQGG